jgi:hypothetical protein
MLKSIKLGGNEIGSSQVNLGYNVLLNFEYTEFIASWEFYWAAGF